MTKFPLEIREFVDIRIIKNSNCDKRRINTNGNFNKIKDILTGNYSLFLKPPIPLSLSNRISNIATKELEFIYCPGVQIGNIWENTDFKVNPRPSQIKYYKGPYPLEDFA